MLVEFSFYVSFYPLQRDFLILIVCFCSIDLSEKKRKKRKVCKSRANIERHTFLCVIIGRYSLPLIVNFTALFLTVLALCVSAFKYFELLYIRGGKGSISQSVYKSQGMNKRLEKTSATSKSPVFKCTYVIVCK